MMMLNEHDMTALGRLSASWLMSCKMLQNPRCNMNMSSGREKPNTIINSPRSKPNGTVNSRRVWEGMKWSQHSPNAMLELFSYPHERS